MRVLVVYASHYGATRGIAERIGYMVHKQGFDVELMSADVDSIDLTDHRFDAFVIGSAVHAGHWLKSAMEFVDKYEDELTGRPVWLFSSGPIGEKYVHKPQPDPADIAEFRGRLNVMGHVVFAGAFDPATADLSKGNWLERQISKRFLPVGDFRDWDEIESWATQIAKDLSLVPVGG